VTQLGVLPGTAVYVYAGASVPSLQSLAAKGVSAVFTAGQLTQILVAFIVFGSTAFGLVMSFLLWQWEWAYLGEREYLRRHAKDTKMS